jgi:hypothetical protein
MRSLLFRMSLSSHDPSSRAILYSLLALSSLHRYGRQRQALQLRTAALNALVESSKTLLVDPTAAAQHVAAGMLLCTSETYCDPDRANHWVRYLIGAKEVIKGAKLESQAGKREIALLLEWVYYHDVFARFSILHFRKHGSGGRIDSKSARLEDPIRDLIAPERQVGSKCVYPCVRVSMLTNMQSQRYQFRPALHRFYACYLAYSTASWLRH